MINFLKHTVLWHLVKVNLLHLWFFSNFTQTISIMTFREQQVWFLLFFLNSLPLSHPLPPFLPPSPLHSPLSSSPPSLLSFLSSFLSVFHSPHFISRFTEVYSIFSIRLLSILSDFPGGSDGKASVYNAGDPHLIPGLGRSPGEGNGNPLQYYCLENPMDRGAWQATVRGVTKSWTRLSNFTPLHFILSFNLVQKDPG